MSLLALTAVTSLAPTSSDIEAVLLDSLRNRFPLVERWEVHPFGREEVNTGGAIKVLQLGARSAVRIGPKTYWYTVSGYRNVVSATRWTAAGEALDSHTGRIEERDIVAAACEPLTQLAQLRGMRARKTLHENDVVCVTSIEPRPAVARGEAVTVTYVGEHITLTTKAIAQADGAVGDTLLVRSSREQSVFPAQVSGTGEVTIHE
jgi:flagella basal body P-ring formation protein FlgA